MRLYVTLALGGIPIGAMYALSAMGIVLIYKTSRVFNFAAGALGLSCAYLASTLAKHGAPAVVAVLLALVLGAVLGGLMEGTLRTVRSPLTGTIITLGWLLLLQGAVGLVYGTQVAKNVPVELVHHGNDPLLNLFDKTLLFTRQQVVILLIAAALAGGLALFFRRSDLGTAMRAVAETPDAARLLGIDVLRINLVAWALGGAVSGLAGVLVVPLLGQLNTTDLIVFTVQALAAALVGRLTSLPLTFAGGVGLGIVQPIVAQALSRFDSLPETNELTAFAVVVVALFLLKRGGRRDVVSGGLLPTALRPLPRGRIAVAGLAGIVAVALVVPALVGDAGNLSRYNVSQVAVWGLATLSLVLLVGVVGQVSICQGVFMAMGAYGAGIAVEHHVPFLLAIPLGAALAAVVAVLVGIPALRLQPLELAIATLSLSFTADRFLYSWAPLASSEGNRDVPRPGFANIDPGHVGAGNRAYAWLALSLFIVACLAVSSLRRGRTGAALTALRSSEPATAAMGFSVVSVKLRGFAASGFLAGVAGALYAGLVQGASGLDFPFTLSISLLAYAVIIGVGSVPGAFVGGIVVTLTTLDFGGGGIANGDATSVTAVLTGLVLIGVLAFSPEGIAGFVEQRRPRLALAA